MINFDRGQSQKYVIKSSDFELAFRSELKGLRVNPLLLLQSLYVLLLFVPTFLPQQPCRFVALARRCDGSPARPEATDFSPTSKTGKFSNTARFSALARVNCRFA
jgi:hypothetical protein